MDPLSFVVWIVLGYITIYIFSNTRKTDSDASTMKPPPVIPIIFILRNLFGLLGTKPRIILTEFAKEYGPLMAFKLGTVQTIIISSAAMAKEALQKNDFCFSNRMVAEVVKMGNHHERSLAWLPATSPIWRNLRKISNSHVFSTSKLNTSKELRMRKVNDLLCYVRKCSEAGIAVDIGHAAFTTTLNLLSTTFFGVDMGDPNSEVALKFRGVIRVILDNAGKLNIVDFFPILKKMDPQGIRRRTIVQYKEMIHIFTSLIDERLQGKGPSEINQGSDVLDALLGINEIDTSLIPELLLDLFIAGVDSTATTFEWAMSELLRNPEILKKVQQELRESLGRGFPVQESDIPRLLYLQAVVKETLRLHPAVPLLPRSVDSDTTLSEFTVPKNAFVFVNLYAIGRDPDNWERPNSFEPERFLGSEIDFKAQNFEFIPFGGAGRRICPGSSLAIRMVHLMLGSLLREYDWKLEGDASPEGISMEDKFGSVLGRAQKLRLIPIAAGV